MTLARAQSALFSIAVRRALYDYLRATGLIMFILLALAWTTDLARTFPEIRAAALARETGVANLLAPYLLHRAADITARLLPMATLVGVILAELARRIRLESTILEAAGFSPRRRLAALLWLGLILGVTQGALEARLRPAAVFAQVESGLGEYARWYRRHWLLGPVWFVGDNRAIRANIRRTDQPEMRNVLIFEGLREPRLQRVLFAEHALPVADTLWRLEHVRIWSDETEGRAPLAVPEMEMDLDVIPQQLSYYGIQKFNLPGPALTALAMRSRAHDAPAIQTAIWRRRTIWLIPAAFALLAAALAQRMFEGRLVQVPRAVVLAGIGYISVVSVKVLWVVGELGTLPAPVAVLLPPVLAVALAIGLSYRRL